MEHEIKATSYMNTMKDDGSVEITAFARVPETGQLFSETFIQDVDDPGLEMKVCISHHPHPHIYLPTLRIEYRPSLGLHVYGLYFKTDNSLEIVHYHNVQPIHLPSQPHHCLTYRLSRSWHDIP